MCWSQSASFAMVAVGGAATVISARRGDPAAIWVAMGYFTTMEVLQATGYNVVDQCGSSSNRLITQLSYLHIAFQPLIINAFCMAIAPRAVSAKMRRLVFAIAGLATGLLLLRLVPMGWAGQCQPGDVMCGAAFCLVSGDWHIAWEVPLHTIWAPVSELIGYRLQFPDYQLAVFVLPLFYGVWRFVVFHALLGPVLASLLTTNPNEMPAIWCLFSVGLIMIGVSPLVRERVFHAQVGRTA